MAAESGPRTLLSPGPPQVSPVGGLLGMLLFLAALAVLFAASLLAYILIRIRGAQAPELGVLHLPGLLWASTVLVVSVSVTLHRALTALRRENLPAFRRLAAWSLAGAVAFVVVQTPALTGLLSLHQSTGPDTPRLYGLIFCLILLHALHVLGGIIALARLWLGARAGRYDHENAHRVRLIALYWHFLDVVWLVMFGTLLGLG
jgi:cytochrome c oxidase subunit 3